MCVLVQKPKHKPTRGHHQKKPLAAAFVDLPRALPPFQATQFRLIQAPPTLRHIQEHDDNNNHLLRRTMGNTTSGKMIKEIVVDAKAILQAGNKGSFEQVVARREDVQRQLLEVSKHKEELLKRRAAGVRAIVKEYEAKREVMLNNLQQSSSPFGTPIPTSTTPGASSSSSSGPIVLPSPDEVLARMRAPSKGASDGSSSSSPSSSSSSSSCSPTPGP